MSQIYEGALFTISTTAAENSSRGLFFNTDIEHEGTKLSRLTMEEEWEDTCVRSPVKHSKSFTRRPLTSRGGVFQERILSPRVLHFDYQELL
ncbi:hypothetical protein CC86DRAFT_430915 [Ophiobolus disseminans]|uniref:Heterokaryon incompatibility domain-containing protein n=1 Tax=Ophiobolus disseminans TaxID=1469910 RepID=A0A6A7AF12_9PLEO|nr:hypothetical protein CC86DRAFT_430915 [Ophiobolus disseminans]